MSNPLNGWMEWPTYGLPQAVKEDRLTTGLLALTELHRNECDDYRRILDALRWSTPIADSQIASVPFIPVQLFKRVKLVSGSQASTVRELNSSGTTGDNRSRIFLNQETTVRQSKALVKIVQEFLGKKRLPTLIVDAKPDSSNRLAAITARDAAVRGMSLFARDIAYLLDPTASSVDLKTLEQFHAKYHDHEVLIFGTTSNVWQSFLGNESIASGAFRFSQATLMHTGGWKKLQHIAVSQQAFKKAAQERFGIQKVHDYYGMAEQVGSVFMACELGQLHAPSFADVIARDTVTWEPKEIGERGVLQTLSLLPLSYPGHSVLTEDYGTILGIDDCPCGRLGKYFKVEGRVPNSEARGCAN